jgi:hypothetical protein
MIGIHISVEADHLMVERPLWNSGALKEAAVASAAD